MTTLREAATMALEALEVTAVSYPVNRHKAALALRAALAAQRKPLTEEEITQCFAGADIIDCSSGQLWVKVARAIERAHGIT